jgi:sugar/nucleoside kinase (ribokinase family)
VIVVLGRPTLDEGGRLSGLAGATAAAASAAGARVDLVGRVTDDAEGDSVVVALGRAGVGHAALLRDPSGSARPLDAADIELGLSYLSECRVLIVADALSDDGLDAALAGARYHSAHIVMAGASSSRRADALLPADSTVLDAPEDDEGAFALLVGRYAAQIDAGRDATAAWQDALTETGWEPSGHGAEETHPE